MSELQPRPLHLVSDSTGETAGAAVRAAASLFEGEALVVELHAFVRSSQQVAAALEAVALRPGPIFYTLADPLLAEALAAGAARLGVGCVDVLAPVTAALARLTGRSPAERPGSRHRVDGDYLARIAAIDYAMAHDDGLSPSRLARADVILTGVSRTSKTPTCIYLACQGVKAANVPLVPGEPPPPVLFEARAAGTPVIGLTASPQRLQQIRRQRLEGLAAGAESYADLERIRDEVTEARLMFEKHGIPVIDVTRRSIEETAAAVRLLVRQRGRA
jgi:hypothetical protein